MNLLAAYDSDPEEDQEEDAALRPSARTSLDAPPATGEG